MSTYNPDTPVRRAEDVLQPLVTVVTVVLNDVKHLEQTILSVLNQTYKNIEYIIIDGGSTDGTVDIIKKYQDRLAFWVSEKDKGIFYATNKGVEKATGEWINYLNSGDYFFNNQVFEKIFSKPHPAADLLYGSFIGNFNNQAVECVAPPSVSDRSWKGMPVCHTAVFARTALMKKFKFNTDYRVSADGEFMVRSAAAGCVFERLDLIVFRVGTLGFSSKNWLKGRLENWKFCRRYFPGVKTDLFHAQGLAREVIFRSFKYVTSLVGLYQLARFIYRKKIQKKLPLLPKNVLPFQD